MAKEAEEQAEQKEKKQIPEKPKKIKGGSSGISMLTLIGIIAGTVVVMVVILSAVFYIFILPDIKGSNETDSTHGEQHVKLKEDSKSESEKYMDELKEEDVVLGSKGTHLLETGKIIANPKGSTKFAVLNLALDYRVSEKDTRFEGAEVTPENPIIRRLSIMIKNKINSRVTSLTVDDFYAIGSDSLRKLIKKDLKPVFLKNKLFLRDVYLQEYLIQ